MSDRAAVIPFQKTFPPLKRCTFASTLTHLLPLWHEGISDRLSLLALNPKRVGIVLNHTMPEAVQMAILSCAEKVFEERHQSPILIPIYVTQDLDTGMVWVHPKNEAFCDCLVVFPFLHLVYDIPGLFTQLRCLLSVHTQTHRSLIIVSMIGDQSLTEIRALCGHHDEHFWGGLQQRFVPMVSTQMLGQLMQRAHFKDVAVDVEAYTIHAGTWDNLIQTLRDSGMTWAGAIRSLFQIRAEPLKDSPMPHTSFAYWRAIAHDFNQNPSLSMDMLWGIGFH